MPIHRIAVAADSLRDIDGLRREFGDRAEIVVGPIGTPAEIKELADGAEALIVTLHRITDELIEAMPDTVRAIGRAGVGLDTIDLAAARARGIDVVYQPYYATNEVADHALTMLLAAQRRICVADRLVREHGWARPDQVGAVRALHELTVGVWGFGRIGRAVARRVLPFAGRVLAYDAEPIDALAEVSVASDPQELLAASDVLTLHLPLDEQTRHTINHTALGLLPPDALLVNVSRGGLVEERALAQALTSGRLGGAALDVFAEEPLPESSPLRSAPNVLLSPHLAWYSVEAGSRLARWTMDDTLRCISDEQPEHGAVA